MRPAHLQAKQAAGAAPSHRAPAPAGCGPWARQHRLRDRRAGVGRVVDDDAQPRGRLGGGVDPEPGDVFAVRVFRAAPGVSEREIHAPGACARWRGLQRVFTAGIHHQEEKQAHQTGHRGCAFLLLTSTLLSP